MVAVAVGPLQGEGHRLNIRCDLRAGHEGPHVADRGMDKPTWVEVWADDLGRVLGAEP